MKYQLRGTRKLMAELFIAFLLITLCHPDITTSAETQMPEDLKVPSDQSFMLEAQGIGVQIYKCMVNKNDSAKFEWVFQRPEADLLDNAGRMIGKHYAGPTWESRDGSQVLGEIVSSYNSPESNSIPWLLLRAKKNIGTGDFSNIVSIQRINTFGGKAPSEECLKRQLDREIRVPYKALYYFYTLRP
ncbi:MAG TPA: DUF3455 domain-containing protein [Dissulfurispiraceae bacterium]|nr:DUF3455 domain-containing protein [Dissulfurispiraceae bacterium]